jgi:hypothetical protein
MRDGVWDRTSTLGYEENGKIWSHSSAPHHHLPAISAPNSMGLNRPFWQIMSYCPAPEVCSSSPVGTTERSRLMLSGGGLI